MVRGNPLLRLKVREHPALIPKTSAHLQSSRRIRGELNHYPFALARFFSKLLERQGRLQSCASSHPLLVVRFKHSHPVSAYTLRECLNQRTTSRYRWLVELLDLEFASRAR